MMFYRVIRIMLILLFISSFAFAQNEFTQADRERMIQVLTKVEEIDKRFEQMDKRIDDLRVDMNMRFQELREDMNARFALIDRRFEELDKRFEQVDHRFEQVNQHFVTITNLMMAIVGAFAVIVVMAIGFAFWDRRTMLRPMEEKVKHMEQNMAATVEQHVQEVAAKVERLVSQASRQAEAEAQKRREVQEMLNEWQSRGGEDARVASALRSYDALRG
jgi:Skp family chaperone for outer membrane proteins